MSVSAQECVASLLASEAPTRLLLIGEPPGGHGIPAEAAIPAADALDTLATLGRFDFVVVCDLLEQVDEPTAEAVLGRLKNLHTDRFLLLADPARSCLGREALLALALAPFERLDDGRIAWRYDIDEYNPERRWNNPDDWAHPENFQRFRW
ncbi:DUF6231 family protein [Wenzhouxiangella sp. XN24]|uniref:DUF6231 family protein n=1 Tax=Wenzhouxiangella sp. XN24 TaxID=2713569 RepID=UPI0013EB8BBB|nr:DUF6231 family protein [Wenzhouxiangella sp. XN24]NGX15047.1 hypothetical protein [Wenzhouxiangella sp. XN24]